MVLTLQWGGFNQAEPASFCWTVCDSAGVTLHPSTPTLPASPQLYFYSLLGLRLWRETYPGKLLAFFPTEALIDGHWLSHSLSCTSGAWASPPPFAHLAIFSQPFCDIPVLVGALLKCNAGCRSSCLCGKLDFWLLKFTFELEAHYCVAESFHQRWTVLWCNFYFTGSIRFSFPLPCAPHMSHTPLPSSLSFLQTLAFIYPWIVVIGIAWLGLL